MVRKLHIAGFLFISLIWGSTWTAIRVVVAEAPPFWAAGLRFLIGAALLATLAKLRGNAFPREPRAWRSLVLLGLAMIAIPYGLLFWAEQRIPSGLAALIFALMPLVVALLSPLILRMPVPRRAVFAMTIGAGGIATVFYGALSFSSWMLAGGFAVLGAVCSNAWGSVYAKKALGGISPVISTAVQFVVGGGALLLASTVMEHGQLNPWSLKAIAAEAYLIVFGSVVTFTIYYWLLESMLPYQLASLNLIVPIIAVVLGVVLFGEPVPPVVIVAMVAVLVSVAMVLKADNSPEILSLRDRAGARR